jgi:hypothetical protein
LIRGPAGSMVELGVRSDDRSNPTIILLSREKMDFDRTNPVPTTTVRAVDPASNKTAKVNQAGERYVSRRTGNFPNSSAFTPASSSAEVYSNSVWASSANEPIVRVYAVGSLLSGTPQESAEKQEAFRELVAAALQDEGSRKTNPSLNFHSRSKALIVKGTPAEHALIQQILGILQENEKAEKPTPTKF